MCCEEQDMWKEKIRDRIKLSEFFKPEGFIPYGCVTLWINYDLRKSNDTYILFSETKKENILEIKIPKLGAGYEYFSR